MSASSSILAPPAGNSSLDAYKKSKDDAKKKQSGDLPPDIDESSGKIINPHNPEFITKVPWYLGKSGPTLKHHSIQKNENFLTLMETDQIIAKNKASVQTSNENKTLVDKVFKKGACRNCGSMNHKEKDCIERPRSLKKSAWKVGVDLSALSADRDMRSSRLDLEKYGKISYDAKRDNWIGFDPSSYQEVIDRYEKIETERRRLKEEEKERQRQAAESARQTVPAEESSGSDSDSDSDNEDGDEDDDLNKTEYLNRDENARDFQSRIARQGGQGGNEMKITQRNLRIREDTPKYLRNLALESAFYDPKSRSMRENPFPDQNPEDLVYAGDNFLRHTGDAVKLAQEQVLCWEMNASDSGRGTEGLDVDVLTNPSQAELLHKQFLVKKKELEESKKRAMLEKYGDGGAGGALDPRLRLGQTETFLEYSRDGRVLRGASSAGFGRVRSKYEEDVFLNNHTTVWGSFFHRPSRRWGFACCHSLVKNSFCVGAKGIPSNDLSNDNIPLNTAPAPAVMTSSAGAGTGAGVTKRSELFGEAAAGKELDEGRVREAVRKLHSDTQTEAGEGGEGKSKSKRGYHSMKGVDVSLEDMEAYRLVKSRRDDPMNMDNFPHQ